MLVLVWNPRQYDAHENHGNHGSRSRKTRVIDSLEDCTRHGAYLGAHLSWVRIDWLLNGKIIHLDLLEGLWEIYGKNQRQLLL